MHRRISLVLAIIAIVFAMAAFTGSVFQTAVVVSEAQAQSGSSSVRPPESAVNVQQSVGGSVRPPSNAVTNAPMEPGVQRERDVLDAMNPAKAETSLANQGANSASTLWGELRAGASGTISIPDQNAALLVQDAGIGWLEWRAKGGPLQMYGGYALAGIIVLLILFYLLRGKVRISHGPAGQTIERFKAIERFAHWVLAVSFIALAISGLNLLYGKDYLLPLVGKDLFATVTMAGKWVHNNLAWAFMGAIIMVFFLWVRHNIPSLLDLKWFAQGGGIIGNKHPQAKKFNAGQKIIFWSVIILGTSISLSGISLLFPYEAPMFAKTFSILNDTGIGPAIWGEPLPTVLTPIQEMMYAQIWHTIVGFAMIFIIIAHIYIGSVGMEGAFDAMGSGQVDRNWAVEHHGLWVDEEDAKARQPHPSATPAE
ncbi:MAG: formate dehydrogenase subunit gamma [Paracoccaceae bacterium]